MKQKLPKRKHKLEGGKKKVFLRTVFLNEVSPRKIGRISAEWKQGLNP